MKPIEEHLDTSKVGSEFMGMLKSLLDLSPEDRYSTKDLLQNSVFDSIRQPGSEKDAP
jgi:hypothetical protein